jgi:hypothetical protein
MGPICTELLLDDERGNEMVSGMNWREEINKEFYFLYANGYALTRIMVEKDEAEAIFTGRNRTVTIRWDETDRIYVQIYRTGFRWNLLEQQTDGANVFELARKVAHHEEIPVEASGLGHQQILRRNADFMQQRLSSVIDGTEWIESIRGNN